jgi:hypothetical protein
MICATSYRRLSGIIPHASGVIRAEAGCSGGGGNRTRARFRLATVGSDRGVVRIAASLSIPSVSPLGISVSALIPHSGISIGIHPKWG